MTAKMIVAEGDTIDVAKTNPNIFPAPWIFAANSDPGLQTLLGATCGKPTETRWSPLLYEPLISIDTTTISQGAGGMMGWIRWEEDDGTYALQLITFACLSKKLRISEYVKYDADGEVIRTESGGDWFAAPPGTIAEGLLSEGCKHAP